MIIGISGKIGSGKDTVGKMIQYLTTVDSPSFEEFKRRHLDKEDDVPNPKFINKKFADKLKDTVCLWLGCTREQLEDREFKEKELGEEWWVCEIIGYYEERELYSAEKLTPRKILQLLGTECGRDIIHPNIWVNSFLAEYKAKPYPNKVEEGKFCVNVYTVVCRSCEKLFNSRDKRAHTCNTCIDDMIPVYPDWVCTDMRFPNEKEAVDKRGFSIRINRSTKVESNGIEEHPSEIALDNEEFKYVVENNSTLENLYNRITSILINEKII